MSGKRQHYIPRFLQRGFSSRLSGDEVFTWVYRKNADPFESNIINVGSEKYFYGQPGAASTDDLITALEGRFADLISNLRAARPGVQKGPEIPALISHLEVRTRHLRQSLLLTSEELTGKLLDLICHGDSFEWVLEFAARNNPNLRALMQLAHSFSPNYLEELKPQFQQTAQHLKILVQELTPQAVKSGHIGALNKLLAQDVRIERYQDLTYMLVDITSQDLILGDSILLFHLDGAKPFKAFLDKDDCMTAAYLPLTPQKLLVAAKEERAGLRFDLNQAIARCSLEYFIAADNTKENILLSGHIGNEASPLTKEELEQILAEVLNQQHS